MVCQYIPSGGDLRMHKCLKATVHTLVGCLCYMSLQHVNLECQLNTIRCGIGDLRTSGMVDAQLILVNV